MNAPVAYDLSRLLLRSFGAGPNGIDRVDLNLGRYFLGAGQGQNSRHSCSTGCGRQSIGSRAAGALLDIVESAWRENLDLADDQTFQELRRRLLRAPALQAGNDAGAHCGRAGLARGDRTADRVGAAAATGDARPVPKNSIFIHATQFPTEPLFRWLDRRPDVKPVFFIHDLLPISHPKFFTAENAEWHRQFLEIFLRYGRAAIVNTEAVKMTCRRLPEIAVERRQADPGGADAGRAIICTSGVARCRIACATLFCRLRHHRAAQEPSAVAQGLAGTGAQRRRRGAETGDRWPPWLEQSGGLRSAGPGAMGRLHVVEVAGLSTAP